MASPGASAQRCQAMATSTRRRKPIPSSAANAPARTALSFSLSPTVLTERTHRRELKGHELAVGAAHSQLACRSSRVGIRFQRQRGATAQPARVELGARLGPSAQFSRIRACPIVGSSAWRRPGSRSPAVSHLDARERAPNSAQTFHCTRTRWRPSKMRLRSLVALAVLPHHAPGVTGGPRPPLGDSV